MSNRYVNLKYYTNHHFVHVLDEFRSLFYPGLTGSDASQIQSGGGVNSNGNANNVPSTSGLRDCAGCCKRITERFLLKALDLYWHEDCLKCGCCDCRLGEVGSTLYTKANLILCKRDYLRYVCAFVCEIIMIMMIFSRFNFVLCIAER